MSLGVKVAKGGYAGDPGLFSFVGKAIKGVAGAVTGGVKGFLKGGVTGALSGAAKGGLSAVLGSRGRPVLKSTAGMVPMTVGGAPPSNSGFMPGTGIQYRGPGGGGINLGYFPAAPDTGGGAAPGSPATYISPSGQACRGHMNRSGYFTQQGYVPPGAKCVPNRRMNPLNPRALNKAMRRIVSAKKAANFLNKIHFGAKPRGRSFGASKCGGKCKR